MGTVARQSEHHEHPLTHCADRAHPSRRESDGLLEAPSSAFEDKTNSGLYALYLVCFLMGYLLVFAALFTYLEREQGHPYTALHSAELIPHCGVCRMDLYRWLVFHSCDAQHCRVSAAQSVRCHGWSERVTLPGMVCCAQIKRSLACW